MLEGSFWWFKSSKSQNYHFLLNLTKLNQGLVNDWLEIQPSNRGEFVLVLKDYEVSFKMTVHIWAQLEVQAEKIL